MNSSTNYNDYTENELNQMGIATYATADGGFWFRNPITGLTEIRF